MLEIGKNYQLFSVITQELLTVKLITISHRAEIVVVQNVNTKRIITCLASKLFLIDKVRLANEINSLEALITKESNNEIAVQQLKILTKWQRTFR